MSRKRRAPPSGKEKIKKNQTQKGGGTIPRRQPQGKKNPPRQGSRRKKTEEATERRQEKSVSVLFVRGGWGGAKSCWAGGVCDEFPKKGGPDFVGGERPEKVGQERISPFKTRGKVSLHKKGNPSTCKPYRGIQRQGLLYRHEGGRGGKTWGIHCRFGGKGYSKRGRLRGHR